MSNQNSNRYEAVIGLEVHAQLLTNSKAYSSDKNEFGENPNTNVSPVTLGHPGTLPVINERTIDFALRLGLAMNSKITKNQYFARKNYFYPDLPKGYQITQDTTPICTGGKILIKLKNQKEKEIRITRIHMEEDAGKSLHDVDIHDSLVDLNRAGTPLLEIVTEPDLRSSEEAYQYLTEIRKLVRYLGICDGNMEEGSLRCDANISVREIGQVEFGTKVEVKNMNSIRNVQRAIEYEINRQIECIQLGQLISQETRGYDAVNGNTYSMRSKEAANDYRYFPEPDLQPIVISDEKIREISDELPELPNQLYKKYTTEYGLSSYDAHVLIESKSISDYFNRLVSQTKHYKIAANWIMGDVKSFLNENGIGMDSFELSPENLSELIQLIVEGKISNTAASQRIFPEMIHSKESPLVVAERLNLVQDSSEDSLNVLIDQIIQVNKNEVDRYLQGETKLLGFFMGQLMKISKGKADPKTSNSLIKKRLDSLNE